MPVKLWEGWEKPHIKGSLRLILDVQRVISGDTKNNSQSFSEGWGCLAQCHYRKYKVSNQGDKTEQSDPLCPGMEVQQMHLAAPSSCCPHHKRLCPQSHGDGRGLKTGWKELQLICLSSSFASPTPLLSPSQIFPFLVIFHHWRRHQVFSSAWNAHLKESTLFCSMCLC